MIHCQVNQQKVATIFKVLKHSVISDSQILRLVIVSCWYSVTVPLDKQQAHAIEESPADTEFEQKIIKQHSCLDA